jgi:hypothetical protein
MVQPPSSGPPLYPYYGYGQSDPIKDEMYKIIDDLNKLTFPWNNEKEKIYQDAKARLTSLVHNPKFERAFPPHIWEGFVSFLTGGAFERFDDDKWRQIDEAQKFIKFFKQEMAVAIDFYRP